MGTRMETNHTPTQAKPQNQTQAHRITQLFSYYATQTRAPYGARHGQL